MQSLKLRLLEAFQDAIDLSLRVVLSQGTEITYYTRSFLSALVLETGRTEQLQVHVRFIAGRKIAATVFVFP